MLPFENFHKSLWTELKTSTSISVMFVRAVRGEVGEGEGDEGEDAREIYEKSFHL